MIDLRTFRSLLNITGLRRKRRDVTFTNLPAVTAKTAEEEGKGEHPVVDSSAITVGRKDSKPRKTIRFRAAKDRGMPESDAADLTITAAQRAINAEAAERERQARERRAKLTQTRLEAVVATGRFAS